MLPYAYSQLQQAAINYHQQQQQRLFVSAGGGLEGLRLAAPYVVSGGFVGLDPGGYRAFDPRTARFVQEEPKPQHSYIGLIAMAILSNAEKKMVLSDIYQWILDNYPYFRSRGPGWRNSIRHNLSLNDCFVKAGRSANGKGHYWAVHPANVDDFKKGDFRRRRAQRKVRRHMGLSVPNEDDDSDDSPCPSPSAAHRRAPFFTAAPRSALPAPRFAPTVVAEDVGSGIRGVDETVRTASGGSPTTSVDEQPCAAAVPPKKRVFDMESLLAPERGKKSSSAESPVNSDSGSASSSATNCQSMLSADFRSAATSAFLSPITATHWPFHATPYMPTAFCPTGPWFVRALPSPPAVVNGFVAEEAASSRGVDEDGPCASPNSNSAAKWQETFAKIMARSYQGRNLSKSSPSEHNADEDST